MSRAPTRCNAAAIRPRIDMVRLYQLGHPCGQARPFAVSFGRVFAIPGICALVFFIFARPQEYFETLQRVPLLYIFCGAIIGGFLVDLRLRRIQPIAVPTLPLACMFLAWCLVCDVM